MNRFVVDASVIVSWKTAIIEINHPAITILNRLSSGEVSLISPDLLFIELPNVLQWKYKLNESEVEEFLTYILDLGLRIDEFSLNERLGAIKLAHGNQLTTYDAHYLFLAQKVGCRLISADKKLLRVKEWVVSPETATRL